MSEELTLHLPDRDLKIRAEAGETLFSALSAVSAFPLDAPCGGLGKCGKCLVTVREPGGEKRQVPACRTPVRRGMELWPEDTALFAQGAGDFALPAPDPAPEGSLGLAFDLGTTTIAASLWALDTGRRLAGIGEKMNSAVSGRTCSPASALGWSGGRPCSGTACAASFAAWRRPCAERRGGTWSGSWAPPRRATR